MITVTIELSDKNIETLNKVAKKNDLGTLNIHDEDYDIEDFEKDTTYLIWCALEELEEADILNH